MNTASIEEAWQELASRSDLIGKEVIFDNRLGGCEDKGMIKKITVENGYVTIESSEIEAAYAEGRTGSPNIRFKIDDERDPHVIGDTIFCDLDDDRQIRISLK